MRHLNNMIDFVNATSFALFSSWDVTSRLTSSKSTKSCFKSSSQRQQSLWSINESACMKALEANSISVRFDDDSSCLERVECQNVCERTFHELHVERTLYCFEFLFQLIARLYAVYCEIIWRKAKYEDIVSKYFIIKTPSHFLNIYEKKLNIKTIQIKVIYDRRVYRRIYDENLCNESQMSESEDTKMNDWFHV